MCRFDPSVSRSHPEMEAVRRRIRTTRRLHQTRARPAFQDLRARCLQVYVYDVRPALVMAGMDDRIASLRPRLPRISWLSGRLCRPSALGKHVVDDATELRRRSARAQHSPVYIITHCGRPSLLGHIAHPGSDAGVLDRHDAGRIRAHWRWRRSRERDNSTVSEARTPDELKVG